MGNSTNSQRRKAGRPGTRGGVGVDGSGLRRCGHLALPALAATCKRTLQVLAVKLCLALLAASAHDAFVHHSSNLTPGNSYRPAAFQIAGSRGTVERRADNIRETAKREAHGIWRPAAPHADDIGRDPRWASRRDSAWDSSLLFHLVGRGLGLGSAHAQGAQDGSASSGSATSSGSSNAPSAREYSATTTSAKANSAKTGSAKAGSAKTGSAKAGSAKTGSAKTGSAKAGTGRASTTRTGAATVDSATAKAAGGTATGATSAGLTATAATPSGPSPVKTGASGEGGSRAVATKAFAAGSGLIPTSLATTSFVGGIAVAANPATRIAMPVADKQAADEQVVALREAFLRNDLSALQRPHDEALREHPLYPYVTQWSLRLRLTQRPIADASAETLQREVVRFLARHEGESVAEQLRKTYLEWLGDRAAWTQLAEEYPKLVFHDEPPLHCLHLMARMKLTAGDRMQQLLLLNEANPVFTAPRALGGSCGRLFGEFKSLGLLEQGMLEQRLRLAIETNQASAMRWAASHLGLAAQDVDRAIDQPERSLRAAPALAQIAWVRLAREDSVEAYRRWQREDTASLPAASRSFILAQIAHISMLRMQPQSIELSRDALRASLPLDPSAQLRGVLGSEETLASMARSALRAGDWDTLLQVLSWMPARARDDPAWQYWRARAYRQAGDEQAARAILADLSRQFHFYGQLALEDLGQKIMVPPRARPPGDEELRAMAARSGIQRAFKFYALGLRPEGNREWWVSTKGMDDRELLAAAELACRRLVRDRCVNTADRTRQEHDFHLRFLMPFRDELEAAARAVQVDPHWTYGLIRQESRFLLDARSGVGAQGLMQIMPTTGRWIAKKLGHEGFRTEELSDLRTNLRFGTYYLRSVLDDLDGSPALASAAYNAGPNRPRSWRSTLPGPVEGAIFAEIIPFNETRDYVKKVLSNTVYYAALTTAQPQSLRQRLGEVIPKHAALSQLP